MAEKIFARVVEELVGSPKDHVEETLKQIIAKIKETYSVKTEKVHETKELEGLWGTFAELEIEFKDVEQLTLYCFDFMPSSIEIITPAKLTLEQREADLLFNDLMAKLHRYEFYMKNLTAENKLLKQKTEGKK